MHANSAEQLHILALQTAAKRPWNKQRSTGKIEQLNEFFI